MAAKQWLLSKIRGDDDDVLKVRNIVDSKTTLKVAKHLQTIIIYAANKRLNLKNSPPYLHGIVTETGEHIHNIFKKSSIDELKTNEYLNIFVANLISHSKRTVKLFKDAKELMEDEKSEWRRELNKQTLVFSHMLSELKMIFKEGKYSPEFKMVKIEARDFWDKQFGKRVIIPWPEFIKHFKSVHKLSSVEEITALKKTIDMLENDHVSWFEFDIFTRLFQPWQHIINNWNIIVIAHPGYKAFMTYDEVEGVLKKWVDKPGSYVFRLSCTRLGQWAIGFVTSDHKIVQTIPHSKSLYQALIDGMEDKTYLYPNGQDVNPDIRARINVSPEQHIKVTKEQFDLYSNIDTTFELCKICDTKLKNVRIEPCGHLLCKDCLLHWMETSGQTRKANEIACPFCREPIMSTEAIVVDPFSPFIDDEDDPRPGPRSAALPAPVSRGIDLLAPAVKPTSPPVLGETAKSTSPTTSPNTSPPGSGDVLNQGLVNQLLSLRTGAATGAKPTSSSASTSMATSPQSSTEGYTQSQAKLLISAARADGRLPSTSLASTASSAPALPPPRTTVGLDPSFPNPVSTLPRRPAEEPHPDVVQGLLDMGFAEDDARKALRIARNDVNVAMDILMSY